MEHLRVTVTSKIIATFVWFRYQLPSWFRNLGSPSFDRNNWRPMQQGRAKGLRTSSWVINKDFGMRELMPRLLESKNFPFKAPAFAVLASCLTAKLLPSTTLFLAALQPED